MATEKYYYTTGRRKTAIASLRLYISAGKSVVNEKSLDEYFPLELERKELYQPLKMAEMDPKDVMVTVKVQGGGHSAQLDAVKLALAKAIVLSDESKKKVLKDAGLLTRDPRAVQRKKAGLRKARKAEQYSKR